MIPSGDSGGVRRTLAGGSRPVTTAHAVGQALAVGPIASIGFVAYLVAATAGGAAPVVIALAFLGALCLAWTLALYARRYAGVGVVYEYMAHARGPTAGVAAAFAYLAGGLLFASGIAVVLGVLVEGAARGRLGLEVPWWPAALASAALAFALARRGLRVALTAQLVLTGASAVPLLILAAHELAQHGLALAPLDPGAAPPGDIFRALLFALFLFAGFESAAALGEEAASHRVVARAMLVTVVVCGVFYLLVAYAATIGFGTARTAELWGGDPLGLAHLADRDVGSGLGAAIEVAVIVDVLAVLLALVNALSRVAFGLARDGLLLRRLARTDERQVPVGGLTLALGAVAAGPAVALLAGAAPLDYFTAVTVAPALLSAPTLVVLGVGALRLAPRPALQWPIVLVGTAFPALGIYGTLHPLPVGAPRTGAVAGAVLAGGVAVAVLFLRARRATTLAAAGGRAAIAER